MRLLPYSLSICIDTIIFRHCSTFFWSAWRAAIFRLYTPAQTPEVRPLPWLHSLAPRVPHDVTSVHVVALLRSWLWKPEFSALLLKLWCVCSLIVSCAFVCLIHRTLEIKTTGWNRDPLAIRVSRCLRIVKWRSPR